MKLQEMSLKLRQQIEDAWVESAEMRLDADRAPELVNVLLFEDASSQWYQVPDIKTWFIAREIKPGLSASVWMLNSEGRVGVENAKPVLDEIMDEYELHRLMMSVPAPVTKLAQAARQVGFRHEGRLRKAAIYNGRIVDTDIFGMVRGDGPRKRKRRSRRSKAEAPTAQGRGQKEA